MKTVSTFIEASRRAKAQSQRRYWVLYVPIILLTVLLIGRGFYLQIISGAQYLNQAERNRVNQQTIPAPRGIFYDETGKQLVENISSTDLVLDPNRLPKVEDEAYLVENLPKLVTTLTPEDIKSALSNTRTTQRPTLLVKALDHDTVLAIEQAGNTVSGASLASSLVRKYTYPFSTAHVLGYTSPVTQSELLKNDQLLSTDTTGKLGLEQTYESLLRGKNGTSSLEVNAAGRPQEDLGQQDPTAGGDIRLTLNVALQEYIYSLFSDRDQTQKKAAGAVIVMEPRTGAIKALVSYPSFDPNVFSQPALRKQATELFANEQQPLFNRATAGTYPSGSIIKPFIAAGGLQEGVITDKTTVFSTGGITIGQWHFYDWKAGGHGVTDVKKALAESVNTFFYVLAGGDETKKGLGVEKIAKYLRAFGWAQPTGVDLPSEATGFIPSPAWKEATFHERWYIGDTYHLGIGQGNVLVTPMQVASATSAVANGTHWYSPHLSSSKTTKKHALPINAKNIGIVRSGMRQAVTDGSAKSLSSLAIALAGKTGTAQIGGSEETHAWFTSFGPYERPQYVVTVLLEKGGAGDVDAVPMAKSIWQWLIEHNGVNH